MRFALLFKCCASVILVVGCSDGENTRNPVSGSGGVVATGGVSNSGGQSGGGDASSNGGDTSSIGGVSSTDAGTSASAAPDGAKAIAMGLSHVCALLNDGSVACWGNNMHGELGETPAVDCCNAKNYCFCNKKPVKVGGITNAVFLAGGGNHVCAGLEGGTMKCWGYNADGQLGDGTTVDSHGPVTVSDLSNVVGATSGLSHTCALLGSGSIKCWGYNRQGELGNGMQVDSRVPASVVGITDATIVTAGEYHNCALLKSGLVKCWGDNVYGQLGDGSKERKSIPVLVGGVSNAVNLAAGYGHACLALVDGTSKCWGYNSDGQLGSGANASSGTPLPVVSISDVAAFGLGRFHTCALVQNGSAYCWGNNNYGQKGNGTTGATNVPAAVTGITDALDIKGGDYDVCVLVPDGSVKCWGDNGFGQLGTGTTEGMSAVPVTAYGAHRPATCTQTQTLCTPDAGTGSGDSYCADLQTDNANCGECGNACLDEKLCILGTCTLTCQANEKLCTVDNTSQCVNTLKDNDNCGGCDQRCTMGGVCSNGRCMICGANQTLCEGDAGANSYCAYTKTDTANCGCCGNTCSPNQACQDGRCESTAGFSFFVFGDMHIGPVNFDATAEIAMKQMAQIDPKVVAAFSNGDVVNGPGDPPWAQHDSIVSAHGYQLDTPCPTSFGARPRYFASVGDQDSATANWLSLWNKYLPALQNLGYNGEDAVYYSVKYGNALFVMLDSQHVSSAQTNWLKSTLASADAQSAQLKFMFSHWPVYSCVTRHSPLGAGLPWVDLAEQYGVNVFFGSHTHVYTRTCPKRNGQCVADGAGPIFVETGAVSGDPRAVDVTTDEVSGLDAAGNARTDAYDCILGQNLNASHESENDFCHVRVDGCTVTVSCYVVGDGNTTPFDTWTVNGCACDSDAGQTCGAPTDGGTGS